MWLPSARHSQCSAEGKVFQSLRLDSGHNALITVCFFNATLASTRSSAVMTRTPCHCLGNHIDCPHENTQEMSTFGRLVEESWFQSHFGAISRKQSYPDQPHLWKTIQNFQTVNRRNGERILRRVEEPFCCSDHPGIQNFLFSLFHLCVQKIRFWLG